MNVQFKQESEPKKAASTEAPAGDSSKKSSPIQARRGGDAKSAPKQGNKQVNKVEGSARTATTQYQKPKKANISPSPQNKSSQNEKQQNEKGYKRKIKLDSNIEIQVNVRDIEEVNEIIEVGYDETTKRKFYKIYFEEEL